MGHRVPEEQPELGKLSLRFAETWCVFNVTAHFGHLYSRISMLSCIDVNLFCSFEQMTKATFYTG